MANLGPENLLHRLRDRLLVGEPSLAPILRHVIDPIAEAVRYEREASKPMCLTGCGNHAIGSHVIPDSYLKRLREGGLAPTTPVVTKRGEVDLGQMNGKTEPVFPGYCNPCDTRMFPWERTQRFGGMSAVELQLMRTADAFTHESRLRARILDQVSAVASSSSEMRDAVSRLGPGPSERFKQQIDSLACASREIHQFALEIGELAQLFRSSASLPSATTGSAHVRHVRVRTSPQIQFADAAWGPRDNIANIEDRVPMVVALLAEDDESHLLLGSTAIGAPLIDRIADHLENDSANFIDYGCHWLLRGSMYWFARPSLLDSLDDNDLATLKTELRFAPFIEASFAPGAGPERTPIVRAGNGWA